MKLALAWTAALALMTAGTAGAHPFDVYPEQYELLAEPGPAPQRLALATTYGLVLSTDGGATWRWVCEAAFGVEGAWAPEYEITATGAITATTAQGMRISRDGCTWTPVAGEPGTLTAAASAYDADGTLWIASIEDGAELRFSDDDGATWQDTGTLSEALWVPSIVVAPSDSRILYVTGDTLEGASRIPRAWSSTDHGDSWNLLPTDGLTVTASSSFYVMAVDPRDTDRVYLKVARSAATREETLYRTTNGGGEWTEVLRVPDFITDVVVRYDGTVLAATPQTGIHRSTDGGGSFLPIPGVDLKATCLAQPGDRQIYVCADNFNPDFMGLGRSTDGGLTWSKLMTMGELAGPLDCPAGTLQQDECRTGAWCFFKNTYGIASSEVSCEAAPDAGVDPPSDPPICSCGAGGAGAPTGLGMGLMVGLLLRRRRRR